METTLPLQLSEFLKYGQSISDYANFRQKLISVKFSANSVTHMLMIIKKVCKQEIACLSSFGKTQNQGIQL